MTPQEANTTSVIVGGITFVEPQQNDYEELYYMYGIDQIDTVQSFPQFCIVHEIHRNELATEENLNKIEQEGESYLIPDTYNGIIKYEHQR